MPTTGTTISDRMTADHFRAIFREHPAGAALITADPGGPFAPAALTATSLISVSSEPPTMAFSLSSASSSTPALRVSSTVVVHLLDSEALHLAKLGSTSGIDRFQDSTLWGRLDTGEPYFKDARIWVKARVIGRLELEGATILAVEGETVGGRDRRGEDAGPLVYVDRTWHRLGEHSALPPR